MLKTLLTLLNISQLCPYHFRNKQYNCVSAHSNSLRTLMKVLELDQKNWIEKNEKFEFLFYSVSQCLVIC